MARVATQPHRFSSLRDPEPGRLYRRVLVALLGLALGVVLALALSPRSAWLVRMQMSGRPSLPNRERLLQGASEAMPYDAGVQAAWGPWNSLNATEPGRLPYEVVRPLVHRFPGNPTALAAALRLSIAGGEAGDLLPVAASGARVDPRNAFFPAMRAALLFQAGKDQEASAALADAARRPKWDDYVAAQVHGGWRLADIAYGEGNVVARLDFMRRVDLSFYKALGAAADSASEYAGRLEKAGRPEAGYRVRRDLLTLGERIRREASTGTGVLAGVRITGAAANHLFGRAKPLTKFALPAAPQGSGAFQDYLREVGHAGEAAEVRALADAGRRAPRLLLSDVNNAMDEWLAFHAWVTVGSLLLLLAAWLLLCGLLARGWRPLPPSARPARRLAAGALPAAFILLIVYGLVCLQTLRVAARMNNQLDQMVRSEAGFYAARAGQTWPD